VQFTTTLGAMTKLLVCLLALLLDHWLGEPRRSHPLAGFARLAEAVQARWGDGATRWRGALAWSLLVLPLCVTAALLAALPSVGLLFEVLVLYLALGAASLAQHGRDVASALSGNDLAAARRRAQWMAGGPLGQPDAEAVAAATIGSVLENGNAALFSILFWYLVLGPAGVVAFRLTHTLALVWRPRPDFVWAALRVDVLLGWVPARLTALTYVLLGDSREAWRRWRRRGGTAGVAVAAGAGALGIQVGGPGIIDAPEGTAPRARDIERALRLVRNGLWLWLGAIVAWSLVASR
jgi:adenosylcobinamide-phosphate synthase